MKITVECTTKEITELLVAVSGLGNDMLHYGMSCDECADKKTERQSATVPFIGIELPPSVNSEKLAEDLKRFLEEETATLNVHLMK